MVFDVDKFLVKMDKQIADAEEHLKKLKKARRHMQKGKVTFNVYLGNYWSDHGGKDGEASGNDLDEALKFAVIDYLRANESKTKIEEIDLSGDISRQLQCSVHKYAVFNGMKYTIEEKTRYDR